MPISEELYMFAERYPHFSNIHTIYRDVISGHYKPSVYMTEDPLKAPEKFEIYDMRATTMFMLYAYFYSMVEDDPQGVNGFRIWLATWPEEEKAIAAVEALVTPLIPGLRLFRNRLGFHGSRSRAHRDIYLTPPGPRYSVCGHERGLSADFAGVGAALQRR